jgi:hypothetical protein
METIFISAFIAALILTALRFWRWTLLIVGAIGLTVLSFGAKADTLEVAAQGGGGAMDGPLFFVLLILLAIWKQARDIVKDRNLWKHHAMKRLALLEEASARLRKIREDVN